MTKNKTTKKGLFMSTNDSAFISLAKYPTMSSARFRVNTKNKNRRRKETTTNKQQIKTSNHVSFKLPSPVSSCCLRNLLILNGLMEYHQYTEESIFLFKPNNNRIANPYAIPHTQHTRLNASAHIFFYLWLFTQDRHQIDTIKFKVHQ